MHPGLKFWLGWGAWLRAWHRYRVQGLEHLDGSDPVMIVGYHGRGYAHDLIILNRVLWERHGSLPVSIMHTAVEADPFWKHVHAGIESVTGDGPELARALAQGRHLVVLPGGNREANRSWKVRYRVDWGERTGYLRLAIRYGLKLVPVASSGVDDAYVGLNDGYRLGKRLELPRALPAWLAVGPLGFVPFSPTFPVRFHQLIGPPVDPRGVDPSDPAQLTALHHRMAGTVQALLDEARARGREG